MEEASEEEEEEHCFLEGNHILLKQVVFGSDNQGKVTMERVFPSYKPETEVAGLVPRRRMESHRFGLKRRAEKGKNRTDNRLIQTIVSSSAQNEDLQESGVSKTMIDHTV